MRRRLLLLPVALLLAGCGSGARQELHQTAQNLRLIHSGNLLMRLVVSPLNGTKGRIGFVLAGPYELRPNGLPIARIVYTQISGTKSASATFISTGTRMFASEHGKTIELKGASTKAIRESARAVGGSSGIGAFGIDDWFDHPSVSNGGLIGGVETDHVKAKLDVVHAANALLSFVGQFGHNAPTLSGSSADQLRKSVISSSIDVWTGKKDKFLRRLQLKAQLGFDVPQELKAALGNIVGANVEFELAIANPNQPIHISPPATK